MGTQASVSLELFSPYLFYLFIYYLQFITIIIIIIIIFFFFVKWNFHLAYIKWTL